MLAAPVYIASQLCCSLHLQIVSLCYGRADIATGDSPKPPKITVVRQKDLVAMSQPLSIQKMKIPLVLHQLGVAVESVLCILCAVKVAQSLVVVHRYPFGMALSAHTQLTVGSIAMKVN